MEIMNYSGRFAKNRYSNATSETVPPLINAVPLYRCEPASMGTIKCDGKAVSGNTVTLTAVPNAGCVFTGWEDGEKNATRKVTLQNNQCWLACFDLKVSIPENPTTGQTTTTTGNEGGTTGGSGIFQTDPANGGSNATQQAAQNGTTATGFLNKALAFGKKNWWWLAIVAVVLFSKTKTATA